MSEKREPGKPVPGKRVGEKRVSEKRTPRRGPRTAPMPTEPPRRTCVVTREVYAPEDMIRVVVGPDLVAEVDYQAKLGGRGAWIRARREEISQAEARPGILAKALDVERCATAGLLERVQAANLRAMLSFLSLAARAGCIASGAEQVKSAIAAGGVAGLIFASDAAERSVASARSESLIDLAWTVALDREALGRRIGKGPRAVLCLRPGGPVRALVRELRRMEELR